jgi:hypothetical protein
VTHKLHDHRPVNLCLPIIAYKSVPQVMKPEVLNPYPFKSPGQTVLDAFYRVCLIGEDKLVGDLPTFLNLSMISITAGVK